MNQDRKALKIFWSIALVLTFTLALFGNSSLAEAEVPPAGRSYKIRSEGYYEGLYQYRCDDLTPADFKWAENGIPAAAIMKITPTMFKFRHDKVFDTYVGGYSLGYYWRKFRVRLPNGKDVYFWASAWNLHHLFYG